METHVKVIGALYVFQGAIAALSALMMLLLLGGSAGIVGLAAPAEGARIAVPILSFLAITFFSLLAILSLPGIVAGIGLIGMRPWARILTIVLSAFNLLAFPIGTAIGLYAMIVLLSGKVDPLFPTAPARDAVPALLVGPNGATLR